MVGLIFYVKNLAHPARFERAIPAFGGRCSIQLSHGCECHNYNYLYVKCKWRLFKLFFVFYGYVSIIVFL